MNKVLVLLILVFIFGLNSTNAQNFSTHQVKQGETIDAIAKRYHVTTLDIFNLNPDAKKELKPNTILIIPISKSKPPKITTTKALEGFKTHKTKRKETLYGICQEYEISQEDLKKYNKFLYANPLKKGDTLQIPVFKTTENAEQNETTMAYTVLPKEGKWRIAYKFGITLEELQLLNPEMGEFLKEGQVVMVPNMEDVEKEVIDEQYSYYKVLPKEGFYRLKLKLGLEKEELETLNPGLKESGLKNGMILKIPYSNLGNGVIQADSIRINLADSISDFNTKNIVIMLPFRLNRVDLSSQEDGKKSIKKDPYLNVSLNFHSGVLMAIDSLKTLGVSLKVDVHDTKHEVSEVSKIIEENDFENTDVVIGPLIPASFKIAASELLNYNIPIVSPIGKNLELSENVFQSRPSDDLLKSKIVNYVKGDTSASNILVISDTKHKAVSNSLKLEFKNIKQVYSNKNKKTGKDYFFVTKEDVETRIRPGKNIVFLETTNPGYVSNVTSILASLIQEENKEEEKEKIDIILVTTNNNSAFEDSEVSNEHLSKLQFCFATSSKTYSISDNNAFVKKYKSKYNITPDKSAVKGFDLTMDVVLRLVSSSDLYSSVNKAQLTEYVENKFAYKKKPLGGYYNDAVYLVKYHDLGIFEVK